MKCGVASIPFSGGSRLNQSQKTSPSRPRRAHLQPRRTSMFSRDASKPALSRCLWVLAGFLLAGCKGDIGDVDVDGVDDVGGVTPPGALPVDGSLGIGATGLRRMTVWEYDNTLRDVLGDTSRPGAALLPEDVRAPFDNDFIAQETSKVLVEAAETLSTGVAARLIADVSRRSSVTGCSPS